VVTVVPSLPPQAARVMTSATMAETGLDRRRVDTR
jgi:hypothetical protein